MPASWAAIRCCTLPLQAISQVTASINIRLHFLFSTFHLCIDYCIFRRLAIALLFGGHCIVAIIRFSMIFSTLHCRYAIELRFYWSYCISFHCFHYSFSHYTAISFSRHCCRRLSQLFSQASCIKAGCFHINTTAFDIDMRFRHWASHISLPRRLAAITDSHSRQGLLRAFAAWMILYITAFAVFWPFSMWMFSAPLPLRRNSHCISTLSRQPRR
jgi:hypothetical protein